MIGFTVADSVASPPKYSLLNVSDFTAAAASVDNVGPVESGESMITNLTQGTKPMEVVNTESGEGDVPLIVLSRKMKMQESKKVNPFRLSRKIRPNAVPPSCQNECAWVFTDKMSERVPRAEVFCYCTVENRHKFHCMISRNIVSMHSHGVYETKMLYQSAGHLQQDQRYPNRFFPESDCEGKRCP